MLNFNKRIIIYIIDIGETHTLNLDKIQYLLNYSINTFGVKKLLNKNKKKNLIINKEGLSIFQFDKNIIIIKEGLSIFQFDKNIIIIKVLVKNRIV